ncbi:hypothetical protein HZF05_20575 [Sphingomonas sp. CGMCC 1.13654]|uniref:DUF4136 domain-containing protein n=1 Tax=Sphingomonas chungangi TaxID=2683589 RepID=A0A838LCM5_9SPHN|nr:hypothetical protein [Sphingomonas chungangi]MBA2936485.1 hypothetical protein [Sphingomonas chungangi]MVW55870.1 hypothetical protein [Sphingomonas chungangi]
MGRYSGLIAAASLALVSLASPASAATAPAGGTIVISPKTADGDYDPALNTFVAAAVETLTDKGFTVLDPTGHSAYQAELTLDRADVGTGYGKSKGDASVSVVGTGVVVPLSTGRSQVVALQRTRIELVIRKRGDPAIVWKGAAVTVRPSGADQKVAADLSNALLHDYPEQPSDVVGVP